MGRNVVSGMFPNERAPSGSKNSLGRKLFAKVFAIYPPVQTKMRKSPLPPLRVASAYRSYLASANPVQKRSVWSKNNPRRLSFSVVARPKKVGISSKLQVFEKTPSVPGLREVLFKVERVRIEEKCNGKIYVQVHGKCCKLAPREQADRVRLALLADVGMACTGCRRL